MISIFSCDKNYKRGRRANIKQKMKKVVTNQKSKLFCQLEIQPGDTIAFVGAGGKTSLMLTLAEEIFNSGFNVAVTTTMKMGTEERSEHSEVIVESDMSNISKLISNVFSILSRNKIPVIFSGVDEVHGRMLGLESSTVDRLAEVVDNLLIEADGGRGKPFKIPMAHEPVVPECVNKLCIVVGFDAVGQPITEKNFYNVEGMVELGAKRGELLTPTLLRMLLFHLSGYLRYKIDNRKIFLLLNKCDDLDKADNIKELTEELFHDSLEKIILTSTRSFPPIKLIADNSGQKIGGVILAAGESTRFAGLKQCADIGGQTLLAHVTKQALDCRLNEIVLVLGFKKRDVLRGLGDLLNNERLTVVENLEYKRGMSTSLKTGLKVLYDRTDAIMFILGDQPKVTKELLNKLIDAYKYSNAQLCLPMINTSDGKRHGHPIIIGRKLYPELLQIAGDIGAREVVKKYINYAKLVELENDSSQFQINTQNDLWEYKRALE